MRLSRHAIVILAATILALPALAAAREPVRDFTLLNTRLRPGDKVWVTDALIARKKIVVYRAPAPGERSSARLSIAPVVTPRARGVAMAYSF